MPSLDALLSDLAGARIGTTFNQYRQASPDDLPGGPAIRLENLRHYLRERARADVVAIGEAAGYQGMRWSGIAFTGEVDLLRWNRGYRRSSSRARPWSEPSGTMVHRLLERLDAERRVILWNTVPTHPHRTGAPLSNRRPTSKEIEAGATFALRLLRAVSPRLVVAIGRVPEGALTRHGVAHLYVRHPSHGGGGRFAAMMREVLAS